MAVVLAGPSIKYTIDVVGDTELTLLVVGNARTYKITGLPDSTTVVNNYIRRLSTDNEKEVVYQKFSDFSARQRPGDQAYFKRPASSEGDLCTSVPVSNLASSNTWDQTKNELFEMTGLRIATAQVSLSSDVRVDTDSPSGLPKAPKNDKYCYLNDEGVISEITAE